MFLSALLAASCMGQIIFLDSLYKAQSTYMVDIVSNDGRGITHESFSGSEPPPSNPNFAIDYTRSYNQGYYGTPSSCSGVVHIANKLRSFTYNGPTQVGKVHYRVIEQTILLVTGSPTAHTSFSGPGTVTEYGYVDPLGGGTKAYLLRNVHEFDSVSPEPQFFNFEPLTLKYNINDPNGRIQNVRVMHATTVEYCKSQLGWIYPNPTTVREGVHFSVGAYWDGAPWFFGDVVYSHYAFQVGPTFHRVPYIGRPGGWRNFDPVLNQYSPNFSATIDWGDGTSETIQNVFVSLIHAYQLPPGVRRKTFYLTSRVKDIDYESTVKYPVVVVKSNLTPPQPRVDESKLESIEIAETGLPAADPDTVYFHQIPTRGTASFKLKWDPVPNATSYNVFRHDDAQHPEHETLIGSAGLSCVFTDHGVPTDKSVFYTVTTVNWHDGDESAPSGAVYARKSSLESTRAWLATVPRSQATWNTPFGRGLNLSGNGAIFGKITRSGTYLVRIHVEAENDCVTDRNMEFTVNQAPPPIITGGELPFGPPEKPYYYKFSVADGVGDKRWRVSAGELPEGLELTGDGEVVGTPETDAFLAGSFTIEVSDAAGKSSTRTFQNFIYEPLTEEQIALANKRVHPRYWGTDFWNAPGGSGGGSPIAAFAPLQLKTSWRPASFFTTDLQDPKVVRIYTAVKNKHYVRCKILANTGGDPVQTQCKVGGEQYKINWSSATPDFEGAGLGPSERYVLYSDLTVPSNRTVYLGSNHEDWKATKTAELVGEGATVVDLEKKLRDGAEQLYEPPARHKFDLEEAARAAKGKPARIWADFRDSYMRRIVWKEVNLEIQTNKGVAEAIYNDSFFSAEWEPNQVNVVKRFINSHHYACAKQEMLNTPDRVEQMREIGEKHGFETVSSGAEEESAKRAVAEQVVAEHPNVDPNTLKFRFYKFSEKAVKAIHSVGKVVMVVAILQDAHELLFVAQDKWRATVTIAGGWAGSLGAAWAATKICVAVMGPFAEEPPGLLIIAVVDLIAGGWGYFVGSEAAGIVYDWCVKKVPDDPNQLGTFMTTAFDAP